MLPDASFRRPRRKPLPTHGVFNMEQTFYCVFTYIIGNSRWYALGPGRTLKGGIQRGG